MVEQIGRDISGVQTMVKQFWTNDLSGLGPGGAWVRYCGGVRFGRSGLRRWQNILEKPDQRSRLLKQSFQVSRCGNEDVDAR